MDQWIKCLLYKREDPGLISSIRVKSWDVGMDLHSHCKHELGEGEAGASLELTGYRPSQTKYLQVHREILSQIIKKGEINPLHLHVHTYSPHT